MTNTRGNHPVWKQRIVRSLHINRSKPEAKYFQLATVNIDGMPAARTVVFRGFSESAHAIYAITDIRSDKYLELKGKPYAQICWYFAKSREQYRFTCTVALLESGTEHNERWQMLSKNTQNSFNSPTPKVPIAFHSEDNIVDSSVVNDSAVNENFVLIKFNITESDYLDLKSTPQFRELESLNHNAWHAVAVNA